MQIRVSYSQLISGPGYNNQRAEAEITLTPEDIVLNDGYVYAFQWAWRKVKAEVHEQLGIVPDKHDDDIPF